MRVVESGRLVAGVVLGLGVCIAAGCSSQRSPEPPKASSAASVAKVSRVVVAIDPSLPADRRDRLTKVDGVSRLTRSIEAELSRTGRLDSKGGPVLEVQVTKYRLRSGATTFAFGLMAGADMLDVKVAVRDGSQLVKEFSTGAGSSGAFAGLDQVSRFERLSTAVSRRLVQQL